MPFTLSHAAVAAPLARRGFILSAAVIGSMAPDFEYFLRLSPLGRWGHTLTGAFLFSLPAGLAMLWTFHAVLKRPLLALAPRAVQEALAPFANRFPFWPARRLARVASSLLAGIACHVFLDGFTHERGFAVLRSEALRSAVSLGPGFRVPLYGVLQDVFSICMALLLLLQVLRWARKQRLDVFAVAMATLFGPAFRVFLALAVPAALLGVAYANMCIPSIPDLRALRLFGGRAFCATCTVLFLEFLGFAWITSIRVREEHEPGS